MASAQQAGVGDGASSTASLYACQRCRAPLVLDPSLLYSINEHARAELTLPVVVVAPAPSAAPAPAATPVQTPSTSDAAAASSPGEKTFYDRLVEPSKPGQGVEAIADHQGFTVVAPGGPEAASAHGSTSSQLSHALRMTAELFDLLSDNAGEVEHPLCEECTDSLLETMEQQLKLSEEEAQQYKSYLQRLDDEQEDAEDLDDDDDDLNDLEDHDNDDATGARSTRIRTSKAKKGAGGQTLQKLREELDQLRLQEQTCKRELEELKVEQKQAQTELEHHLEKKRELEEQEHSYWVEYSKHKRALLAAEDEFRSLDCRQRYISNQMEKLKKTDVFSATFHIWHTGHFATINGFRLGRLPSAPVEWSEINAAWGQTALLLWSLARTVGLENFARYQLVPYGSYSYLKVLSDDKTLPLYGSGGFRMIFDTKFDLAMVAFLDCLQQFAAEVHKQGCFSLPYEMDKGKIRDNNSGQLYSIKLQFNSEDSWTKACRYMLTNLKWGLAFVAMQYMKHGVDPESEPSSSSAGGTNPNQPSASTTPT